MKIEIKIEIKINIYIYVYFFGSQMTALNGFVNQGCTKMKSVKRPLATVQRSSERS